MIINLKEISNWIVNIEVLKFHLLVICYHAFMLIIYCDNLSSRVYIILVNRTMVKM